MQLFEEYNGSLCYRQDGETVLLTPWGANGLRVRAKILSDIEDGSVALLDVPTPPAKITIEPYSASIVCGNLKAVLTLGWGGSMQISYYNQRGELLLQECSAGGALTLKARHFKALPGGGFRLKATFVSDPTEKLYGMGQYQQEILNLKGCNLELAHRNAQASVPFCLSSRGYGFLWHNAAIGAVHFGLNTTEWEAACTQQLDYWVTAGDTPAEILEAYTAVTGRPPMMPEYGLGYWQCKLRYYNQEQVLDIAREYKRRQIPLDVLVIDYYHWPRCGDWRFDEEYFPDPAAMVKELKEMGIETMVSIWPQVDPRSENYREMRQQGLLVKCNNGIDVQMLFHGNNVFTDVTNPRARRYIWDKCSQNYGRIGIRTFWLDEAEPEFTGYDFENYRYYAGAVAETGNIYPREFARAFYEGQKASGEDEIVNLIRCAWIGSQRYGALVWSGDIQSTYEDFRKQLCAGIHMGLCGIPWWTTDIGGFHNGVVDSEDFRELLIRWFQFGAFSPVMRMHGSRRPHQPIINSAGEVREVTGADNEVWSFGEDNYEIMVKFIRIREQMRDYTRELMRQAHEKGTPVMRALFYEFPDDADCWDCKDEYLYGADILVAPVCHAHALERKVYLPAGASWIHAGTGETYEGGKNYLVSAPMDTLPVFLRDGRQSWLIGKL